MATISEGENAEKIVARHIRLLHTYNEAKDAAQILIGRVSFLLAIPSILSCSFHKMATYMRTNQRVDPQQLAALRGTTVRGVHEELGLGLGDD